MGRAREVEARLSTLTSNSISENIAINRPDALRLNSWT
jgi:hypothetical protein